MRLLNLIAVAIAALLSYSQAAAAPIAGSNVINRSNLDTAPGEVYIYAGGHFDAGLTVGNFQFWAGGSGVMTALLFEETATDEFTVRGIAQHQIVTATNNVQNFQFNAQSTATTANANYTFGFINARMDIFNGNIVQTSTGTVDMDTSVQAGDGAGGPGTTNDWYFTPSIGLTNLQVGDVFDVSPITGEHQLNTGRTYSAQLFTQINEPVPAPAMALLALLGALVLGARRVRRGA